jgi:hypothetical protein
MVDRYQIEAALEEWRDQCVAAGIDEADYLVLFSPELTKDLARHIMMRVREAR